VVWPLAVGAQHAGPMPVIGLLTPANLPDWAMNAIRTGLDEAGFVEGRNFTMMVRSAEGQFDRLPALAADLVKSQVNVILATGSPVPARTAKAATTKIPIVFAYGGDPGSRPKNCSLASLRQIFLTLPAAGAQRSVLGGKIADTRRPGPAASRRRDEAMVLVL